MVGFGGVVAYPSEFRGEDPRFLPTTVYAVLRGLDGSLMNTAMRLMSRRVHGISEDDRREVSLGAARGVWFDWTDGILDNESFCFLTTSSQVLELTLSHKTLGSDEERIPLQRKLGKFVDLAILVDAMCGVGPNPI